VLQCVVAACCCSVCLCVTVSDVAYAKLMDFRIPICYIEIPDSCNSVIQNFSVSGK